MADLTVATTIIEQMGGTRRLQAMVGAHDFLGDDKSAQFGFKGCRKANKCRVVYDYGSDLYTFELWHFNKRTFDFKKVFELDGVYWDMLKSLFEEETGLYLSL
jgi:hypothetical protein